MQRTRPLDLFQFALDPRHPVADQPAIGLDLGFAGTAEEAEAAALALEVGPAADQPAGLIVEMRELDLEPPFRGCRPLAENFEDQAGAVDHFGAGFVFQILLLDRGQGGVDNHQSGLVLLCRSGDLLDLALAEQSRRTDRADADRTPPRDDDADRFCEALGFVEPGLGRAPGAVARKFRRDHQRPLPARDLDRAIAVEAIQGSPPAPRPPGPARD